MGKGKQGTSLEGKLLPRLHHPSPAAKRSLAPAHNCPAIIHVRADKDVACAVLGRGVVKEEGGEVHGHRRRGGMSRTRDHRHWL
jgi:hypothetical protein